ncbi:MAG TPA: SpoIIE family protein phosphatase [Candidatus Polarisedimenticolaceae bacterium]|nr:SpoIIE family protein phosphatase [Candidatus Polarisedimenticolaceae bacterium]
MSESSRTRLPLGVLYAALAALLLWVLAYRIPMTLEMLAIAWHPSTVPATPIVPDWPDGFIQSTSREIDQIATPPLKRRDRIVSIDGEPFETPAQVVRRFRTAVPGTHLAVVVSRSDGHGGETTIPSSVLARSVGDAAHITAFRVLAIALGLIMPWVGLGVGFWVTAVRPRDPAAWLVLLMLLGFSQIAAIQSYAYLFWPDPLRIAGALYGELSQLTWPIWFTLFGAQFAGRLPWERRHGWIKWALVGPLAAFAVCDVVVTLAEQGNVRALAPFAHALTVSADVVQVASMGSISFFFVVMGWKKGVVESADALRRIRILFWGATIALTPLLVLLIASVVTSRSLDTFPIAAIAGALLVVPVFPLTLAYVILVDKAMDVRVAVRQGLRYAAARGTIRVVGFLFMLAALWNAWNLINDPSANRPRKIEAIALMAAAAVVVPRFAKKAMDWTDRRFFREAYDAEHVLTNLSDEVRTIVETEPLLDTVIDRIGSTLHVEKLVVFLLEKEWLVPVRSRGFDLAPAVAFPVSADAIRRLAASGRPARVRYEDPESPLRREAISEESRSRLAQVDAEIILPLIGKSDLLGAITLGPKKSEEPYSLSDSKLLGLVATQTGLALENSRLTATIAREIASRERMSREIEIARDVQQKLFPQRVPAVDGIDCAGFCRPAQGVGGDYYDFLALPGGRLGIALGDVAGKGIPAALLMASLQASLRGQRLSGPTDLAQLITNLNYLIYEASPDNRYATFFYGELDPGSRRLDFVNAGHNAPMLFRGNGGTLERLSASGPVVGLVDGGKFEQRSVELARGDLLVVYSDGISEAMNPDEQEWGETRLAAAIRDARDVPASGLIERLFTAADAFAAGAMQHDDMTVVVVRVA